MTKPTAVPLWRASLLCRCPRCGLGRLFSGYLKVAAACPVCHLSYGFAEHGDGPAVFVILIAGALISGSAMFIELRYAPPVWVHVILWGPVTVALCLGLLPVLKALLVAMQFRYRPDEGSWEG